MFSYYIIIILGVKIGAPYNTIGLIKLSKSVVSDLKESFDLLTVF